MQKIAKDEFLDFAKDKKSVTIEEVAVLVGTKWSIKSIGPPREYVPETTTVWSFPDRGDWATHVGNYRGNWSPYIPRNLILRYTKPGELVLDPFVGGGTTAIEAKLLGRQCIALDINDHALRQTHSRTRFSGGSVGELSLLHGDAAHLPIRD